MTVETDAADSTHRIQFEQMQVHEALGEGVRLRGRVGAGVRARARARARARVRVGV